MIRDKEHAPIISLVAFLGNPVYFVRFARPKKQRRHALILAETRRVLELKRNNVVKFVINITQL